MINNIVQESHWRVSCPSDGRRDTLTRHSIITTVSLLLVLSSPYLVCLHIKTESVNISLVFVGSQDTLVSGVEKLQQRDGKREPESTDQIEDNGVDIRSIVFPVPKKYFLYWTFNVCSTGECRVTGIRSVYRCRSTFPPTIYTKNRPTCIRVDFEGNKIFFFCLINWPSKRSGVVFFDVFF